MIAANIATMLAASGRRVCLIDADFHNPAQHILFKVDDETSQHSFADFLLGHCEIGQTVVDLTPRLGALNLPGNLYFVSGFSQTDVRKALEGEGFPLENLKEGLDALMDDLQLDYIVMDTSAGLDERALPLVAIVDILIVVMLLDKQDYQGTSVVVDVARRMGVPEIYIIVNNVSMSFSHAQVSDEVRAAYRANAVFVVPHDPALLQPDRYDITTPEHFNLSFAAAMKHIEGALAL